MATGGHAAASVTVPDTKLAREATDISEADRAEITALHPRPDFKHAATVWSWPW